MCSGGEEGGGGRGGEGGEEIGHLRAITKVSSSFLFFFIYCNLHLFFVAIASPVHSPSKREGKDGG